MALTTSHFPPDTTEPVLDTTVGGILREAAAEVPDAVALVEGTPDPSARRRWTYAELLAAAERAAFARPPAGAAVDVAELFDFCREHLAAFKTPRTWVVVEAFATTASGKIQKYVLRDRLAAGEYPSDAVVKK